MAPPIPKPNGVNSNTGSPSSAPQTVTSKIIVQSSSANQICPKGSLPLEYADKFIKEKWNYSDLRSHLKIWWKNSPPPLGDEMIRKVKDCLLARYDGVKETGITKRLQDVSLALRMTERIPREPVQPSTNPPSPRSASLGTVQQIPKIIPRSLPVPTLIPTSIPRALGRVSGRIFDSDGKPMEALVSIEGPSIFRFDVSPDGELGNVDLTPGKYLIKVEATGFLTTMRRLEVRPDEKHPLNITLRKRPDRPTVRLTTKEIVINRPLSFDVNETEILPQQYPTLDEVADILIRTPQITKVRIEGHTDDTGSNAINQKLSQSRADAVKNYLVQAGISPDRLETLGYSSSRPIMPNITNRIRARNRRVVFTIFEQQ
jgi:outer membrane protein OmpA-like peptidoglycan-associated protein